MSIVTKTGDDGATALMYNRRVPKTDPRVAACGEVDELMAALGVARAAVEDRSLQGRIRLVQRQLVQLMGELATDHRDSERFRRDGFVPVQAPLIEELEEWARVWEAAAPAFKDWALPGDTLASAALDLARAICRRAERAVWGLLENGQAENRQMAIYLNRLSDILWLMGRQVEKSARNAPGTYV